MRRSLCQLGQLTPLQAYRVGESLEAFDGIKRLRAAQSLSWASVRLEVHALDPVGAKLRVLLCNAATGLSELEEAWVIRSLYREDKLGQPRIAQLLQRHKSWVCRRLTLAEGLSDELTASVRLGLVSATTARLGSTCCPSTSPTMPPARLSDTEVVAALIGSGETANELMANYGDLPDAPLAPQGVRLAVHHGRPR